MTRGSTAFKRRACRFSGTGADGSRTAAVVGHFRPGLVLAIGRMTLPVTAVHLEPSMRRSILLALAAVAVVVSFTACRDRSTPPSSPPAAGGEERAAAPDPHAGAPALLRSRDGVAPLVEPIAPPPGGMAIADVWGKREALNGAEVTVRGRVVKVNNQIMGRNWVHLQDGSGSEADGTHDLTVTTDAEVTAGDTVTFTGVLAVDKDFGSGYGYPAILENGRLVR
jgi:hypothetical protein